MKYLLCLFAVVCLASCAGSPAPIPAITQTPNLLPPLRPSTPTAVPTRTVSATRASTALPPPTPTTKVTETQVVAAAPASPVAVTKAPPIPTEPPSSNDPVLVGAGDIAVCDATGDETTAAILDKIEGTVFTLGDNAYPNGTPEQFQTCYQESWGRHKARTRPAPGNHEYLTEGARGYFEYFGARAGDPSRGYYSYDLGAWHIIVLNSEVGTGENSEQLQWLRDDLAQHPAQCTLAMFHRSLFSSGPHGQDGEGDNMLPAWNVLYENNVELVLGAHDHAYERFAPQNPQGEPDAARGIRQFVVGTGGGPPYPFGIIRPNSEKRLAGPPGVLKLTLHPTSYNWEFVSIAPLLFNDRGQTECH